MQTNYIFTISTLASLGIYALGNIYNKYCSDAQKDIDSSVSSLNNIIYWYNLQNFKQTPLVIKERSEIIKEISANLIKDRDDFSKEIILTSILCLNNKGLPGEIIKKIIDYAHPITDRKKYIDNFCSLILTKEVFYFSNHNIINDIKTIMQNSPSPNDNILAKNHAIELLKKEVHSKEAHLKTTNNNETLQSNDATSANISSHLSLLLEAIEQYSLNDSLIKNCAAEIVLIGTAAAGLYEFMPSEDAFSAALN